MGGTIFVDARIAYIVSELQFFTDVIYGEDKEATQKDFIEVLHWLKDLISRML